MRPGMIVSPFELCAKIWAACLMLRKDSPEARQLLLRTAAQESNLVHVRQLGGGPGLGLFQMEPFTFFDCFETYLDYRPELRDAVLATSRNSGEPDPEEMVENHVFAAAMARVRYLRAPGAIPRDLEGQAQYWKEHYNTADGKGTVEEFVRNAELVHLPEIFG